MRMSWTGSIIALIMTPLALVGLAAWYMLYVPGRGHRGPLPPATGEVRDLAGRLKAHVTATASVPHNVQHDEALGAAAHHIERSLQNLGYPIALQPFTVDGSTVRNIEATREARLRDSATSTLVIGAH